MGLVFVARRIGVFDVSGDRGVRFDIGTQFLDIALCQFAQVMRSLVNVANGHLLICFEGNGNDACIHLIGEHAGRNGVPIEVREQVRERSAVRIGDLLLVGKMAERLL